MDNFTEQFNLLKAKGFTLVEARDELLDNAVTSDEVYDINQTYEKLYFN